MVYKIDLFFSLAMKVALFVFCVRWSNFENSYNIAIEILCAENRSFGRVSRSNCVYGRVNCSFTSRSTVKTFFISTPSPLLFSALLVHVLQTEHQSQLLIALVFFFFFFFFSNLRFPLSLIIW